MFIAHGQFLQKYAHWILAGVLVLLVPGFVMLFSPSANVKQQRAQLPTIDDKPVNFAEFQTERTTAMAEVTLNRGRQPALTTKLDNELKVRAVQRLILLRKASELGIRVTDDEVIGQIRSLSLLQNEQRQFDLDRYQRYMIYLNNLGISESQYEQVIREQLMLAQLRALVGSAMKVTPTELQLAYAPSHEETTIDYVEFNADQHKEPIDVKDDEARAFYAQNREKFRKPAMVKVRYVYFAIPDARKSVTVGDDELAEYYDRNKAKYVDDAKKPKPLADVKDEVKNDLLDLRAERAAGDRATGFSVKLVHEPGTPSPDFTKIAADSGVTPKETDFFDLHGVVSGIGTNQQFNQAAFTLGSDMPFSDPVRGKDGYYVLEYVASQPSEVPPFEQVQDKVIDVIKRQHAYEATVKQGRELDTKVKAAVAAGKTFPDVCASLGLKRKSFGPFTMLEETTNFPFASRVKEMVLGMPTNAVSDFIPTPTGGLFFQLQQRTSPKPDDFEKDKQQMEAQLLEQNRDALFQDWANSVVRDEHVDYKIKTPTPQQEQPTEEPEPAPQPAPAS